MSEIAKKSPTIKTITTINGAAADSGGDSFVNTGKELLIVEHTNAGGSAVTLTFTVFKDVEGLDVPDRTLTIQPGDRAVIGPFSKGIYNDADGKVQISYDDATDIEVAVLVP
jgi:hypothetical protein